MKQMCYKTTTIDKHCIKGGWCLIYKYHLLWCMFGNYIDSKHLNKTLTLYT